MTQKEYWECSEEELLESFAVTEEGLSTKTAENSHPAGGKSARFSDVSRACFTAENPREKSVGNSGFSRGFRAKFTQFSSLLYREILWCEIVRAAA